jgi:hypothetical protein
MRELMEQLRLQALVVQTETDASLDLRRHARVLEQSGSVAEERNGLTIAKERCHGDVRRWLAALAARVDPTVCACVQELEARVAEQLGERVAQATRPLRVGQLDHEGSQPRTPPPRGQSHQADPRRHGQ